MTSPSKNDITGDLIKTKTTTKQYRDGWDAIFGKQEKAWKEQDKLGPCWGHEVENQKEESESSKP